MLKLKIVFNGTFTNKKEGGKKNMKFQDLIERFKTKPPAELLEKILEDYQEKIEKLNKLEKDLKSLNPNGFRQEFSLVISKLKGPQELVRAEAEISSLIKRIEVQRKREKEEIENLFSETNSLIKKAILSTRRPEILAGLKILEAELSNSFNRFNGEEVSCEETKAIISSYQEQAEILNIPTSKEEEKLKETYYEILGVSPKTDQEEIRRKYLQKAQDYHPDCQPPGSKKWVKKQAEETMKKITEAYEVLSDPVKRREYDLKIGVNR